MKRKALFFDFDGVLHNTFDFHLDRIQKHFGITLSAEAYRSMHDGNFFNATVPEGLEHADWPEYTASIREELSAFIANADEKKCLQDFSKEYELFLVTSGSRSPVEGYLKTNNVLEYFTDARYSEDGFSKVEKFKDLFAIHDVLPENALFITDTVGDVHEADTVGLRSVTVTFGYHDRARLESANPYKIVDSWEEIREVVGDAFAEI